MKKYILSIALIGLSISTGAQNALPPSGSVGIGTTSPSIWFNDEVLEVQNERPTLSINSIGTYGTLAFTNAQINSSTHYGEFHFNHAYESSNPSKSTFRFGAYPGGDMLILQADGNIGIGTKTPAAKLELNGGDLLIKGKIQDAGDLIFQTSSAVQLGRVWTGGTSTTSSRLNLSSGDNTSDLSIYSSGNVGVGTVIAPGAKLAVNGDIRAKEVKVTITGWSDFVFYDDYKLPTLKEVEKHIRKKGHLKDIPSAKHVENDGILLGEMNAKLLQKIEELTLYTIQQQKEIEILKTEKQAFDLMNQKMLKIQKRLISLEKK